MFDITRRESFEHVDLWIKEVRQYCTDGLDRIRMVLIGNKLDRVEEREVHIPPMVSIVLTLRFLCISFLPLSSAGIS